MIRLNNRMYISAAAGIPAVNKEEVRNALYPISQITPTLLILLTEVLLQEQCDQQTLQQNLAELNATLESTVAAEQVIARSRPAALEEVSKLKQYARDMINLSMLKCNTGLKVDGQAIDIIKQASLAHKRFLDKV